MPREGFGLAIDLGTTTVAMQLLNLQTGQAIAGHGFVNPQRQFGADVISRIDSANRGQLHQLQHCICTALEHHTQQLLQGRPLSQTIISGNTTMVHTLLGYDCACLGAVPFEPTTPLQNPYSLPLGAVGANAPVRVIPWISAFVGGDITSGLLCIPRKNTCLLVDLGTNGEIALCHAGEIFATATAAGPAFEGMRPGLFGSQVLAMAANNELEPRELAQVQLAKSAVRTGVEILLDLAGRPEVDAVYLCGGMGQAMHEEDALAIGLFPAAFAGKIIPAGNTSLGGAARLLRNPTAMHELSGITNARHINLAEQPQFDDYYMEYLSFDCE
jgi:uncharacterized 2Fe-2S/4Fe-4S cluster protein (DUF4445 family)